MLSSLVTTTDPTFCLGCGRPWPVCDCPYPEVVDAYFAEPEGED